MTGMLLENIFIKVACHDFIMSLPEDVREAAKDIVVQDQWLVMTVGYFKKIFPETAECAGWKDRGFNNKNQIIRIILYPFLCMLTAGIFMLFR